MTTNRFFGRAALTAIFLTLAVSLSARGSDEPVGVRPYEMDWADRTEDDGPALLDFETFGDWTLQTENAVASFTQSRAEQMFGQYVGKLVYRRADAGDKTAPVVRVYLAEPIPVPESFDAVSCWIEGNNWAWVTDPKTPRVRVSLVFELEGGAPYAVELRRVDWNEWFLCYRRLNEKQIADLNKPGTVFRGFCIEGGTNDEDRDLYFDSLRLFKEEFAPLEFSRRPKRNIELFPGQSAGQNTGDGTLPFPTGPETILPKNGTADFRNDVQKTDDGAYRFSYNGSDGRLEYLYRPEKGDWSDITARWNDSAFFSPLAEGGVTELAGEGEKIEPVESASLESASLDGGTLAVRWNLKSATAAAVVEYRLGIAGKNLILDTLCPGGRVDKVAFGRVEKIQNVRNILIPYYSYGYAVRPAALIFDVENAGAPLFALGNIDWYRSGASYLRGAYEAGADFGVTNGAAEYHPKTDKTRNDVFERFVFTVSPKFDETLPTIANPVSPWKRVTGKGVWRAHGASNRQKDKDYWYNVWRHGMRHIIVTDHETCWRDGGESFTFRTRPAPKKGGDAGWVDYADYMQNTLGFVYGPYNNFTDFAPVNEYWSPDMVSRTESNELQSAWARCYAPKPSRAVEYCEKLSPINESKFHFSTAYCDVHSSVTPWSRTDYDPRVPGAGTFAAVYYAYGEIMLLQKAAWDGPVYSEGPHHCFYSGLTDGNYAQDQAYRFMNRPWLVDFDLLKMHPLECDFGMGNIGMFAPGYAPKDDTEREALLDRFLTATITFGHPGFLAMDYGVSGAMRSYFLIQPIAERYTLADVESIRYLDDAGEPLETDRAIAENVFADNRLVVRYNDGTTVAANGGTAKPMTATLDGETISLAPNCFEARSGDGAVRVMSKNDAAGHRFDYAVSPEFIYFDGRGTAQKTDKALGAGQGVCRILEDGRYEIIPVNGARIGFKIDGGRATALNFKNEEIGQTPLTRSRGYTFVEPVDGAFSYRVEPDGDKLPAGLDYERFTVVPGETVTVFDAADPSKKYDVAIPSDAKPYTLYTASVNGGEKIDFAIAPLCETLFSPIENNRVSVSVRCNLPKLDALEANVSIRGETTALPLKLVDGVGTLAFDLPAPVEGETPLELTFAGGGLTQKINKTLKTTLDYPVFAFDFGDRPLGLKPKVWMRVRGKEPTRDLGDSGGNFHPSDGISCGGAVKYGLVAHPPYIGGPGRVWAEYALTLPNEPAVFEMSVGKRDGSDRGDGIWYSVEAVDDSGEVVTLAETAVDDYLWKPFSADLSKYAGKRVTLRLVVDCGPADNTSSDWAAAAELRLRGVEKIFSTRLD